MIGSPALGWSAAYETTVMRVLVGFLFLFFAGSVIEKNRLRRAYGELLEAMNMLLYGKDYRRDRAAIRILLNGLRSKEEKVRRSSWENLKRLTGQDFAMDAGVWAAWWAANERRFAAGAKRSHEKDDPGA